MYRIGFSKDIHRLVSGRKLILGGVIIPFHLGEEAHSDGDVIYHALAEAILGSLALGDLGKYFPPSDENIKDIDSAVIVDKSMSLIAERSYEIVNVDIHVLLEKPKLATYIEKMRSNIAILLKTDIGNIAISAGTNEGLGKVGKSEAVEASAIVLIKKV
jgi:2-C-methyl-D-erythritol 2,4-cyclodiphosphate synthase